MDQALLKRLDDVSALRADAADASPSLAAICITIAPTLTVDALHVKLIESRTIILSSIYESCLTKSCFFFFFLESFFVENLTPNVKINAEKGSQWSKKHFNIGQDSESNAYSLMDGRCSERCIRM
jgi:hypothetical protein